MPVDAIVVSVMLGGAGQKLGGIIDMVQAAEVHELPLYPRHILFSKDPAPLCLLLRPVDRSQSLSLARLVQAPSHQADNLDCSQQHSECHKLLKFAADVSKHLNMVTHTRRSAARVCARLRCFTR